MPRRSATYLLIALQSACLGGEGESNDTTDPGDRTTTPYDPALGDPASPASITPDAAARAVPVLFQALRSLAPETALAKYLAFYALGDGDDDCIEREVNTVDGETNVFWYADGCTLENGAYFEGSGAHVVTHLVEDGATIDYVSFGDDGARFDIVAPDGTFMRGSPSVELLTIVNPDGSSEFEAYFSGVFETDPVTAAGNPWLLGELEGSFSLHAADDGDGGRELGVYGVALVGADPEGGIAYAIPELAIDNDPSCAGRAGAVWMRDRDGAWHVADFGASAEDGGVAAGACDACASLSHDGAPLGDFCAPAQTFDDLLAWEGAPW